MRNITNQLPQIRFKRHMTQAELASKVGCSVHTITNIERNHQIPNLELAFKLAHALDTRVNDLFQA